MAQDNNGKTESRSEEKSLNQGLKRGRNLGTVEPKKVKKLGPIRTGAVVPTVVIIVLGGLYFSYFFDSHLRKSLEWVGTRVHGAEVNIGGLNIRWTAPSLTVSQIQVTDKNKPHRNLIQVERVHFGLLWDALLRAKFVVEEADIENIQALVPRKRPGYVVPQSETKARSEVLDKLEAGVLAQTQSQFNKNILGDVASLVGGADPSAQLKSLQTELKSDARVKELEKVLSEKEKLWQQRLKELPQAKEFEALVARAKKLKFDSKNPVEVAKAINEADKILKEGDAKVKALEKASKELKGDVKGFEAQFQEFEELAKSDLVDLQKRLKIPNINVADFSMGLFGRLLETKLVSLRKYMEMGRQYMPPKKTAEEKAQAEAERIVPRERGAGRNFHYPVNRGYPKFWLKKALISSKTSASEFSGNLSGEVLNLTSSPVELGKPTEVRVKGDFPKQQILGLDAHVLIDHTTSEPYEKAKVIVASYPVSDLKLSESKDVKMSMTEAQGQMQTDVTLKNNKIWLNSVHNFKELNYDIDAKSRTVKEVLKNVVKDIPIVTVESKVSGAWNKLNISLRSNLGDELSRGFRKQLEAKLAEAKEKMKAFVDERIRVEKARLESQFNKSKQDLMAQVNQKKSELDAAQEKAEADIKGEQKKATSDAKRKVKKEADKALKDLKKKFGL